MSTYKIHHNNFIYKIIDKDLSCGKYTTVRTRFPPEPNGYLHIGHSKSICLNFGIAKYFKGNCNLRFDDTNPVKENIEYIESIKKDIKWLGFQWSGKICYSSDYFEKLYSYAIELIRKGLAYVDELSLEEIREYRGTVMSPGKKSPYRDRSTRENLIMFEKMRKGSFEEGKACLRAKIDMSSPFIIMRDPVLYRIKFATHHQTGNQWCIYPMYDFTHCLSDVQEGITHSICTMEFQDNRRLYDWVLDNIDIPVRPRQYEFSRLNLEYTVLSKRKLDFIIKSKCVEGWDDPRMPTISGLRRRGYTASSIRNFCERIGITKKNHTIKYSLLESCIREELNRSAPRAMAVINPIKLVIENYPAEVSEIITMLNHPNKPEMGSRKVPFSREIWIDYNDFRETADINYKRLVLGKKVRLRNAYFIKAIRIEKDKKGNITSIFCTYDADTMKKNLKKDKSINNGVIHWVSIKHALSVEFRIYDRLFIVPNPNENKNLLDIINPNSLIIKRGFVEPALKEAEIGKVYQFEREGYFCLDNHYSTEKKMVFNLTVGLRNTGKN